MEKDAKYFLVGLFVTLTLVAAIAFSIWIAGVHDSRNYERYTVYFTDPVSGLKEGASVQYKGVEVGKVQMIRLAPERKDLIKVDIEVDEITPVRAGTDASLTMLGVTGLVYMELTTELTDTAPVPYVQGERYPVIKGSGTQLAKLLQDIPRITENILEISERTKAFLNEDNIATLANTLQNLESMTKDMNGLLSDENVASVSVTLENMSASSGDVQELIEKFRLTADEIENSVHAVSEVITRNEEKFDKFANEGLDQITRMSEETQKMAESIRKAAEKLNEDPSQLIYQPSHRGVEIPK